MFYLRTILWQHNAWHHVSHDTHSCCILCIFGQVLDYHVLGPRWGLHDIRSHLSCPRCGHIVMFNVWAMVTTVQTPFVKIPSPCVYWVESKVHQVSTWSFQMMLINYNFYLTLGMCTTRGLWRYSGKDYTELTEVTDSTVLLNVNYSNAGHWILNIISNIFGGPLWVSGTPAMWLLESRDTRAQGK